MWRVNNRWTTVKKFPTANHFYDEFKWLHCETLRGTSTPSDPLVNIDLSYCEHLR